MERSWIERNEGSKWDWRTDGVDDWKGFDRVWKEPPHAHRVDETHGGDVFLSFYTERRKKKEREETSVAAVAGATALLVGFAEWAMSLGQALFQIHGWNIEGLNALLVSLWFHK